LQSTSARQHVIAGKFAPPVAPVGSIARPHLVQRLAGGERVALVIAPPGYGKSEVARQWSAADSGPTAWLAVDLLDRNPASFWRGLVATLRMVIPEVDDEPDLLLSERGPADLTFLAALIAQVESLGAAAAIVIDDVSRLTDRTVLDGIALLVDRVGHLVRFVIIGRSDPAFPLARWRSAGWVSELREEHLRFTDAEAISLASTFTELDVNSDAAVGLGKRVEGWPAGLHLVLLSIANASDPESMAAAVAGSDRILADYLVAEVVDRLPDAERDVALALSVFDWFDADLCSGALGVDAVPVAYELYHRRLFLTMIDEPTGAMRFHHLFRELLETELRWRDAPRRVMLHRRAAELWSARGDMNAAYRHLIRIDDHRGACAIVLPMALELADRGDIIALSEHMHSLPTSMTVDDPSSAFDLSVSWFFAGDDLAATRWCNRAEELLSADDPRDQLRLHATRAFLALMRGEVGIATAHVADFERFAELVTPESPLELRFATIGARTALAARRFDEARVWVERMNTIGDPDAVALVTVPAVNAWIEFETGDLRRATALAAAAYETGERLGARPYHGTIEALIATAWCRLAAGDLRGADDAVESVHSDIDGLGWAWYRTRVALLTVEIRRLRSGPSAALAAIKQLRASIARGVSGGTTDWADAAEALALIGCGEYDAARQRIDGLDDGPRARLLRASLLVSTRSGEPVEPLLADRGRWTLAERLEADVLIACADGSSQLAERLLTAAVEVGNESGWVSPFLGHGEHTDRLLRRMPLERLHPALARALHPAPGSGDPGPRRLIEPLTPREMTVLELLSTHLTYAQIGERLYVSVNTVKTNLKSTYRKLHVTSRADAVDAAIEMGLLDDHGPRRLGG
jgi:LuxR family maltose regulon positive regulatory protein